MVQCFGSVLVSSRSYEVISDSMTKTQNYKNEIVLVDPKQKLTDYSRRGIFNDGQLFPKHVTRVFPSELEPESHHNKKLKWESILAMNQDLGIRSKF